MADAEKHFGLTHDETVATLSGAHTIGKSRVHGVNPTSRGVVSYSVIVERSTGICRRPLSTLLYVLQRLRCCAV